MARSTPVRILGFNGLRGCCVILVYLSHKCGLGYNAAPMGVWTFLALSGFLIIGELHKQRHKIEASDYGATTGLRIFFTKRAIRIFPAYYGVLTILLVFSHFFSTDGQDLGFRYHFLYLSNVWFGYLAPHIGGPFGVLWTLSVEQQFYVLAPFAFILTPSCWHVRICVWVALIAALGHILMQAAGVDPIGIYMTSPWNLAVIALGGCAGMLLSKGCFAEQLRGPLFLGVCGVAIAAYAGRQSQNPEEGVVFFAATTALVGLVAWIFVNQDSLVVRCLEWRPLEYLGVVSYGFYLIHNFVPNPLGKILPLYFGVAYSPIVKVTLGAAIGFVISFALAHISWTYYERPVLALRDSLLPRSRRLPSLSTGARGENKGALT